MNISSFINPQSVELTEEQQVILDEIKWQLSLCLLDPSDFAALRECNIEAVNDPEAHYGVAIRASIGRGFASIFLPMGLYKDGFIHPTGAVDYRSGGRAAMIPVLKLAAQVMEGLHALSEETLAYGPRSKWEQRQIELNDWD
jgi:hypothetical protein